MQSDLNGDGTYTIKTKVDSIGWGDVIRIMSRGQHAGGKGDVPGDPSRMP